MVEFFIILLLLIIGVLSYIIYAFNKKNKTLTSWVENFITKIISVNQRIHEVDIGGAFEADDEVGATFTEIRDIINELNELLEKEDQAK